MGIGKLQSQLFDLLDSRLGTFKTPFQARNYKKVILSIQKSKILNQAEINVLFVKANRFLSKDSVKKEKVKIKGEVKAGFITGQNAKEGRVFMKDGQLVESSGSEYEDYDDEDGEGKESGSDGFVTDSDSEEEVTTAKKPKNKRLEKEDDRNRIYL